MNELTMFYLFFSFLSILLVYLLSPYAFKSKYQHFYGNIF